MSERKAKNYLIEATVEENDLVDELTENSPFQRKTLLRIALRIGLEAIKKDPSILMPYISKKMQQ